MKIVGITGRSGCGKSSATKFLAGQGYPCIDADLIARQILLPGSPCLAALRERFGDDILDTNGTLQRRLLADRAFATPEGTRALTDITQPEILRRIEEELTIARHPGPPLPLWMVRSLWAHLFKHAAMRFFLSQHLMK